MTEYFLTKLNKNKANFNINKNVNSSNSLLQQISIYKIILMITIVML
jgi:hypothetical protein